MSSEKTLKIDTSRIKRASNTDLDIPIGSDVVIHAITQEKRFRTTFIGLEKNKYILVRFSEQKIGQPLHKSDPLAVRYIKGSLICGFSSSVADTIVKPLPILFIHYPDSFEILNLRQDDRAYCFQPVTVFWETLEGKGKIIDISRSGCKIIVDQKNNDAFSNIAMGAEIFCMFTMPDYEEDLYAKGLVRYGKLKGDKLKLGVQFLDLAEEVKEAIEHYVASTVEYMEIDLLHKTE